MAKAYLCVVRKSPPASVATIDLEKLPPGASSSIVVDFKNHGVDIGSWLQEDLDRSAKIAENIKNRIYGAEELNFISHVASFFENLPPADEEKDLVFFAIQGQSDILRTSPAVALHTAQGIAAL